jgi:hypothetical protein
VRCTGSTKGVLMAVPKQTNEPTRPLTRLEKLRRIVWNNENSNQQVAVEDWLAFEAERRRQRERRGGMK